MTAKQTILKFIYPLFSRFGRLSNKNSLSRVNTNHTLSLVSFYSLKGMLNNRVAFDFASLKGKKVLLVNLASNCGFTAQYQELEKLNQLYKSKLVILGFPANDFRSQEPGSNEEIEAFCRVNYRVTFTLFAKASVLKPGQQEVFKWLTDKEKNGWNDQAPSWNFCKYLVDENGELLCIFKPQVSPMNTELLKMIEKPVAISKQQQYPEISETIEGSVVR